jgi:protein-arginine kinase activator protein McsA
MNKKCVGCNREKPLSSFGKNSSQPSGINYICLECARNRRRDQLDVELERKVRVLFNGRCVLCDTVENLEIVPMANTKWRTPRAMVLICSRCKAKGIPTASPYRRDCARCNYSWFARKNVTTTCPSCGSAYWHVPRK